MALLVPISNLPSSHAQNPGALTSGKTGFESSISGAYQGQVRGGGTLKFLANAGFKQQGYYFLADGQGVRPFGVTFVLPRGIGRGKHSLKSPSPLDIGTLPSVRVDRDLGASVASADRKTSGFLNLTAFPRDERTLVGARVQGSFEFETESVAGERIKVTGWFSFKIR
jgi:hypothetical protein